MHSACIMAMKYTIGAIALFVAGAFALTQTSSAQIPEFNLPTPGAGVQCHIFDKDQPVPTGYGAAFNVFSTQMETIMRANCKHNKATLKVGNGSNRQYVYDTIYEWTGGEWVRRSLNSNRKNGRWHRGGASIVIPKEPQELLDNTYFVAYTCMWANNKWNCGCADEACATPNWQVQGYRLETAMDDAGDDTGGSSGSDDTATSSATTTQIKLDSNLAALDMGHYEGWAIVGDDKYSTGKFAHDDDMYFMIPDTLDPDDIEKFVVTIEPEGDTDDMPSGIVILAGDFDSDDMSDLMFPVDFASASGTAILATPSDGADTNETSGVWFLDLNPTDGPAAGLVLPDLPDGWVYEGWAVTEGTPLTAGRFTDVNAADDFDGFSGPEATPAFPGEDFLENAPTGVTFPLDLAFGDSTIVISVEPDMNGVDPTGDGPAQAKPLLYGIPQGTDDHVNFYLEHNLDSLPEGTAKIMM